MRILLADDSVTAQNMGKKILAEAGHEVFTVSNGAAALKKINEERPDLIILDIYMPGYTGLEVCQRVKESREISRTPVLLTVGKLEPFKKEDARRVRAEAVVVKPFEASELMAAVTKIAEFVVPRPSDGKSPSSAKHKGARHAHSADEVSQPDSSEEMDAIHLPPMDIDAALAESERKEAAKLAAEAAQTSARAEDRQSEGEHAGTETKNDDAMKPAFPSEVPAEAREMAVEPTDPGLSDAPAGSKSHHPSAMARPAESARKMADDDLVAEYLARAVAAAQAEEAFVPPMARAAAASPDSSPRTAVLIPEAPAFPAEPPALRAPASAPGLAESVMSAAAAPSLADPVPLIPTAVAAAASSFDAASQDPAFIADRTEELKSFPTHFGVKETVREPEPVSSQEDEVAAALASLPGDEPDGSEMKRAGQAWVEEMPIEDGENAVLLEDEMSMAAAAASSASAASVLVGSMTPAASAAGRAFDAGLDVLSGPSAVAGRTPEPVPLSAAPAEFTVTAPAEKPSYKSAPFPAAGPQPAAPAKVPAIAAWDNQAMASAAMPGSRTAQPGSGFAADACAPEVPAVDVAAVESVVSRVLDELKPRLVAQILQELAAGKK